jgi:hypothetical protein
MTKKLEEQSNIHFSQTDTKRVFSIGSLDLIIYLSTLCSLSYLVFISVAAQLVA